MKLPLRRQRLSTRCRGRRLPKECFASGVPHAPAMAAGRRTSGSWSLQVWKEILGPDLAQKVRGHGRKTCAPRIPRSCSSRPLAASSLIENGAGPLQIYLALSAIDSERHPESKLSEAAARLLSERFVEFNAWYPIFAEFPSLGRHVNLWLYRQCQSDRQDSGLCPALPCAWCVSSRDRNLADTLPARGRFQTEP